MSLINKIFSKKAKSDKLADKAKPQKAVPTKDKKEQTTVEKDKKDLTLQELQDRESDVKGSKAKTVVKEKSKNTKDAYRYIIRPLVTEKGTYLNSENKYIFEVAPRANKITVKKAIWNIYGVWPEKVNIIKVRGKKVRYGRVRGVTKNWKKAVVALKEGETISVYEGV